MSTLYRKAEGNKIYKTMNQQYLIIFTDGIERTVSTTNWFSLEMYEAEQLREMIVIDLHAGKQLVGLSETTDGKCKKTAIWADVEEDHL